MVTNLDEALRSLTIAQRELQEGNLNKAIKFAKKSISLHPTDQAQSFLLSLSSTSSSSSTTSTYSDPTTHDGVRNRRAHSTSTSASSSSSSLPDLPPQRDFTPEQAAIVKRIQSIKSTDFYAILSLDNDASENDIKKSYRKLALVLHPDKNGAPGADEAFKKVSKAFSILSDPDKRQQYDRFGRDPESRPGGGGGDSSHPFRGHHPFSGHPGFMFDGDIDPEVIFSAFFGPGFQFQHHNQRPHFTTRRTHASSSSSSSRSSSFPLLQFLPILMLIGFSFLNWLISGPNHPDYSFNPTNRYNHETMTRNHNIPLYVHGPTWHKFRQRYPGHVAEFLDDVETTYVNKLADNCRREKGIRDSAIQRAVGWGIIEPNQIELEQAKAVPMPSCTKLNNLGYKIRY